MSATLIIIIATCLVSYQGFNNNVFFDKLKHYPYLEARNKSYSRWLSAGFLHGSWAHLLINMFVLYQFGTAVENFIVVQKGAVMGRTLFTLSYILMVALANIPTYLKHKNNPGFASIGASGAVSGILFMFILLDPWRMLYLFFIVPCPAFVAGVLYLIYSSWASRKGHDRIDHDAHFYGAIWGLVFMILLYPGSIQLFISNLTNVPFL